MGDMLAFPQPAAHPAPASGVWGARAAWNRVQAHQEDHVLGHGEEECGICLAASVAVNFKPCKHGACLSCTENLRRTAVLSVSPMIQLWP